MIELLTTKQFIPRPRKVLVSRPRLIERLTAGIDKKLTLIAAPAGFGKTSLLSEWIPQSPRCVTWLSLDEGDNDPTKFWAYFISSLQGLRPDLGSSALALLQSLQAPPIPSILTALLNDIATFPEAFAIVLDDFHVIDFPPIHEGLTLLINHLPANMHLVITSRIDPPLSLARLRARDELTELRATDLRFTAEETAAFLNQVMGLNLSEEEVVALEARTEGWIAGLQIAALSMQGRDDIQGFIQAFSGSHRHILGYLAEEVLVHQPENILQFLLQTSILTRLCGPLCDSVTGNSDGQKILENLELANLFITPLDNDGTWYRYHHLFAEVLQVRLQQSHGDQVRELHRRAGNWYARHNMMDVAVQHALAGADFEEAARLTENLAGDMVRKGSGASLVRWLDAMPKEMIRARPRLCLARGWTHLFGFVPNFENVDHWAQLAIQGAAKQSPESDLNGEVAVFQATTASVRWDIRRSRELSEQALDHLPLNSPWRSLMALCLGTAQFYSGNVVGAKYALGEALRLSQDDGAHYIQLMSASYIAESHILQGKLGRAMEECQQVLAWATHGLPQRGTVIARSGMANILCEYNQHDAALTQLELGMEEIEQVGGVWVAFELYRNLARVHCARGKWVDALNDLERISQSGHKSQVSLVLPQVEALRAQVQLAQGDLGAAEAWAANSGLSPDDSESGSPGVRQVEYLSFARVLNAQGRHTEALSLLERLLQAAQAEERFGSVIGILILQCLVARMQGNTAYALTLLERALVLGEPEGYIHIFVDEGEAMRLLLTDYRSDVEKRTITGLDSKSPYLLTYIAKLLSVFPQSTPAQKSKDGTILEPLSERELDILRLIATGCSNQEIAETLVIAVSTVKSHINNLYGKLGTNRRTQAIAIARDLGLLSE